MLIEVYSDGSSDGKSGGRCGYAFVICVDGVKVAEGSGSISQGTNNVAEVVSALRGLEYIATTDLPGITDGTVITNTSGTHEENGTRVVLISDSQLTLKWATGEYRCKKWHLIPHVIQLRKLLQRLNAETRWVRGHNGDEHNERCDILAGEAREAGPDDKRTTKSD